MKSKFGFGIMEVLAAAVVLGFLIVGLNILQKGNREGILRVRARDAASFVAQHVLDSISAAGMKAIDKHITNCPNNTNLIYCDSNYVYKFEGNSNRSNKIDVETKYVVEVSLLDLEGTTKSSDETTLFQANTNIYSQSLEAKVSWKHRNSMQSIKMARVVK